MLAPIVFTSSDPSDYSFSKEVPWNVSSLTSEQWLTHPASLYGYSIFETTRTYQGKVLHLNSHLERLQKSADILGWTLPSLEEIHTQIEQSYHMIYKWHPHLEMSVRWMWTHDAHWRLTFTLLDMDYPLCSLKVGRLIDPPNPANVLPRTVKHAHRFNWLHAVHTQGVDEVLLIDQQGFLLESNRSAVMIVEEDQEGKLEFIFPSQHDQLLPSITRATFLKFAKNKGLSISLKPIQNLTSCRAIYLLSSLKTMSWVSHLSTHAFNPPPLECLNLQKDFLQFYLQS